MRHLGTHWIARARGCPRAGLADPDRVSACLRELPDALGLTRIGEPLVHVRPDGLAGVVLLSESHASVHTSPAEGTLYADIFSCSPFDPDGAEHIVRRTFEPADLDTQLLDRGSAAPTGLRELPGGRRTLLGTPRSGGVTLDLEVDRIVFESRSDHQHLLVVDTIRHGRALYLDGVLQSATADEGDYHRALVHPALCAHPAPRSVLIGGGGEGAVAREVLRHDRVERVLMVDFDRQVVDACQAYLPGLGAWDDPRLQVRHRDFLGTVAETPGSWDVVLVDLTDDGLEPALGPDALRTVERSLAPGGVVAFGLGPSTDPAALTRVRVVFEEALPYSRWIESHGRHWTFVVSRPPQRPLAPWSTDTWAGLTWAPEPGATWR